MSELKTDYNQIKEKAVTGRYVTNKDVFPFLNKVAKDFPVEKIGTSVLSKDIKIITLGTGKKKVLMWSQMHGNESTTTKAVLDFINLLNSSDELASFIKDNCTIKIIPILNPDGAEAYTRVNANAIDLNRDAQDRSQPESVVLRSVYDSFKPDYCFNLHDQRTIFNTADIPKPATVSFLAPAHDQERTISATRAISMQIIVAMNSMLQKHIPGQVGRYDDGFNSNCVGDAFQMLNTPTILFESGHYPEDYEREQTREYIYNSIVKGVEVITKNTIQEYNVGDYITIPENNKLFFDILITNAELLDDSLEKNTSIGVLFKETLDENEIKFIPRIEKTGDLSGFYGHKLYNCLNNKDVESLKKQQELLKLLIID